MTRARRNGIGEKRSPCYCAVCLFFSGHLNFQAPPPDIICDRLKCKIHHRNRENVIFRLTPIFSYKTVSKGGGIAYTFYNLLVALNVIADANWSACILIKVGVNQRGGNLRWCAWLQILEKMSGAAPLKGKALSTRAIYPKKINPGSEQVLCILASQYLTLWELGCICLPHPPYR